MDFIHDTSLFMSCIDLKFIQMNSQHYTFSIECIEREKRDFTPTKQSAAMIFRISYALSISFTHFPVVVNYA